MTLNHDSGTEISLEEAEVCAHAFQEGNPDAIKSFYVGENKLKRVLQQEGCMGIRIYNGYDTNQNNKANLVMVGVDKNGKDMTNGVILDRLAHCPSVCPQSSPLMKNTL